MDRPKAFNFFFIAIIIFQNEIIVMIINHMKNNGKKND